MSLCGVITVALALSWLVGFVLDGLFGVLKGPAGACQRDPFWVQVGPLSEGSPHEEFGRMFKPSPIVCDHAPLGAPLAQPVGDAGGLAIAQRFRQWVCSELAAVSQQERQALRGDYLFVIDGRPRFVVCVDDNWSGSAEIDAATARIAPDGSLANHLGSEDVRQLVDSKSCRTTVATSTRILERLLMGTMRARHAYMGGHVSIEGDLPGFLRLVALLKARGVAPLVSACAKSSDAQTQ